MAEERGVARALISVYDKTGVVEFARELASLKIEIFPREEPRSLLRDAGIASAGRRRADRLAGNAGGRVKTLHPKVHGGILFQREKAEDRKQVAGTFDRADRSGGGESVSVFGDGGEAGRDAGGVDREHRYWRAGDGAVGGEEFSKRGRGYRSRRITRRWRANCAKSGELSLATRLDAGEKSVRAHGAI